MKLDFRFIITYSDGTQSVLPLEDGQTGLEDLYTGAYFSWEDCPRGRTCGITLKAKAERPVRFVDMQVQLPEHIFSDDTKVFVSAYTTNDVAQVSLLKSLGCCHSRDCVLYENSGSLFGAAFITADRFFTYIRIDGQRLFLRHSMEDKPLFINQSYRLEKMLFCLPESSGEFFDTYTDKLKEHYDIPRLDIPTGWCSWSCWYQNVDEQKVRTAGEELKRYFTAKKCNTVQIDDGWQRGGSFCGEWLPKEKEFPSLGTLGDELSKQGFTFGLWLAPLLASRDSGFFTRHPGLKHVQNTPEADNSYMCGSDPVYTLELDSRETLEHIRSVFRRCNKEYGAEYFKLDFLTFALFKLSDFARKEHFVIYKQDYASAVYRKVIAAIRQEVGDAFFLACGAPISEGIGLFNGIRVTPDIIWGKMKSAPTAWEIIKMCICSISCRYYYNGKIFVNDPDGLVVRGFDFNDGFDVTYNEARTWAAAVAMSGGSSLINEQMERIGADRRDMYSFILPPLGRAARPVDFFELPQPSRLFIKNPDGSVIAALFNFDDRMQDLILETEKTGITGEFACLRTWVREVTVAKDKIVYENAVGHSCEVFAAAPLEDKPRFLFAACNIYGGAGIFSQSFEEESGILNIQISPDISRCDGNEFYIYLPNGYDAPDMKAEEKMRTAHGRIFSLKAKAPGMRIKTVKSNKDKQ